MAKGVYKITEDFEQVLCDYTGAPYCVTVDNESNALFLSLVYEGIKGKEIIVPSRTYMSVPCAIIFAGGKVRFRHIIGKTLKGSYLLEGSKTIDSALRFTYGMYQPGYYVCLSFTGPYKHLKLSKGGAILTDDLEAHRWFKRARFSGRNECSYHEDEFTMLGWNFYLLPELSARGLLMMQQFWNLDGTPVHNEDKEIPYPDLSKFKIYTEC